MNLKVVKILLATACLLSASLTPAGAQAAGTAAVLSTTVTGGAASQEAKTAAALGLTVTVIDPATWSTMTEAQFTAFDLIILGDPTCAVGEGPVAAAAANPAWAKAADGNVLLIGADPIYHYYYSTGARTLVQKGIAFAAADAGSGKTGAYVTLSCYYHFSTANTPVPFLNGFGTFAVVGAGVTGALNNVKIVATHPALSGLTDAALSDWGNSVHESFGVLASSWPSDFEVLAIAVGSSGNFTAPDGTRGYPYILARGVIPDRCGDGVLGPAEECDDGNNTDGDGCDKACNTEDACTDGDGDGVCDAVDKCKGNDAAGDSDADGTCDDLDQCPTDPLNDQDGDGFCANADNCPTVANPDQKDTDGDSQGDACDSDDDNDGVSDTTDNCQYVPNPDQADYDHDGAGNACDTDDDGDGVLDAGDSCVQTPAGEIADYKGCSLSQLCPCDKGWKNHGAYVSCNAHESERFVSEGLISEEEKDEWMSAAGSSSCGQK